MTNGEGNIADLGIRIAAAIVDLIILYVIMAIIGGIFLRAVLFGGYGFFFGLPLMALSFVLFVLYFTFFEVYMNGQSPGKIVVKIKVVKVDGGPIDIGASLIRNILRIVDYLPALYLLGFILVAVSDKRQRLGDMAASTIVVKAE